MTDALQQRHDRRILTYLEGLFPDRRVAKLFPPDDGFQNGDHEFHGFRVFGAPPVTLIIQHSVLKDSTRLAPLLEGRDVSHKIRFVKRGEALLILDVDREIALEIISFS